MSEVFFLKYSIIMFNGKPFNEKFLFTRKYYDFARAISCTRKLTCVRLRSHASQGTVWIKDSQISRFGWWYLIYDNLYGNHPKKLLVLSGNIIMYVDEPSSNNAEMYAAINLIKHHKSSVECSLCDDSLAIVVIYGMYIWEW